MPFNGSGAFVPVAAPNWPAVAGQPIYASQFNTVLSDVFSGLGQCLTRDGQGGPSGNLNMAGFKHINAGEANASGQYLVYGQTTDARLVGALGLGVAPTAKLDVNGASYLRGDGSLVAVFTGESTTIRQKGSGGTMYFDVGSEGGAGAFHWRNTSGFYDAMVLDTSNELHLFGRSSLVGAKQLNLRGAAGGYGAGISFRSNLSGSGADAEMARITADGEAAWDATSANQDASIRFRVTTDGILTERAKLSGAGLSVGSPLTDSALRVNSPTGCQLLIGASGLANNFSIATEHFFQNVAGVDRVRIHPEGTVTIFAPDSGTSLIVNGVGGVGAAVAATGYIYQNMAGVTQVTPADGNGAYLGITGTTTWRVITEGVERFKTSGGVFTVAGSAVVSNGLTVAAGGTIVNGSTQLNGNLTFTGTLTGLTGPMVTTALGFTPYNATNPSGFITSAALASYAPLTSPALTGNPTVNGGALQRAESGTYTPTGAGTVNVNAGDITFSLARWVRVGNVVTVSGRLSVNPVSGNTFFEASITALPVPPATFTNQSHLSGVAIGSVGSDNNCPYAQIFANTTSGNTALIAGHIFGDNFFLDYGYSFSYLAA